MTCPLGQSFPLHVPCGPPPALYTRIFACTLEELPRPPRLVFFSFKSPPPQCLEPKRNECTTRSHHFGHRRSAVIIAWSPSVTLRPAPAPQSRSAFSNAPSPLVCPPTHPFEKTLGPILCALHGLKVPSPLVSFSRGAAGHSDSGHSFQPSGWVQVLHGDQLDCKRHESSRQ